MAGKKISVGEMTSEANLIKWLRESPITTTGCRLVLGLVFLYASYDKILDPGSFAIAVQNYQLIPISLTNLTAIFLPWLEFYCAICLLLGWWTKPASLLIILMNIIFITALSLAYLRGLDIDCGCFGTASTVNLTRIGEDLILLGLSLHILFNSRSRFALENIWGRQGRLSRSN